MRYGGRLLGLQWGTLVVLGVAGGMGGKGAGCEIPGTGRSLLFQRYVRAI